MDSMNNKSEESAVKEKQKTSAKLPSANPAGSVDLETAGPVLQSSCHTALANCRRDRRCRLLLEPMLNSCAADSCHRQQCMKHMQEFYDQSDSVLVMDAALCVCRRSDAGESGCVAAMQRLHPACASQPEGGRLPSCLRVARHCRRQWDGRCRPRLERYEQACAVDVVTARCAGPSEHCRSALLAVLGTELHSHCGCHDAPAAGSTPGQHSCHDWERLLWANPCVELSQREYLLRKPSGSPLHGPPAPVQPPSSSRRRQAALPDSQRLVTDSAADDATVVPSQPHCVVRKPGRPDDFILVGAGVRYYRLKGNSDPYRDEKDCSELCMCHGRGRLVCNVLDCLEKRECQSSLALYHHGTAGLVSYQEGCVCHHGDFICARPADDDYSLPFGVFLFLGYSRAEQDMLYPHTHKTIRQYVVEELKNILDVILKRQDLGTQDWQCTLSIHEHFESNNNIIIQARLRPEQKLNNRTVNQEILRREKSECSGPLREISRMINHREPAVLSHPLLSVVKTSDVEVTIPDLSGGRARCYPSVVLPAFSLLLLLLLGHRSTPT